MRLHPLEPRLAETPRCRNMPCAAPLCRPASSLAPYHRLISRLGGAESAGSGQTPGCTMVDTRGRTGAHGPWGVLRRDGGRQWTVASREEVG